MIRHLLAAIAFGLATPFALWHGRKRGMPWRAILQRWRVPASLQPADLWLHGVSAGEVRSLEPLVRWLQRHAPQLRLVISTGTAVGLQEARQLAGAERVFLLPFDLPWVMRSLLKRLNPKWLILAEGDLWWNMLQESQRRGTRRAILGAKVSDRSLRRWSFCLPLARRLWGMIDLFCAQSSEMADRLYQLAPQAQIKVTGSLKLDRQPARLGEQELRQWRERLALQPDRPTLLVGSTHPGEELLLAQQLQLLVAAGWQILLCPRHPQRSSQILAELRAVGLSVQTLQDQQCAADPADIRLVGQFGVLTQLMQLANVVVLGGSFLPGVGGHNILEPLQLRRPVLWGPYMANQRDLVQRVRDIEGGESVLPECLSDAAQDWAERPVPELPAGQALLATLQALRDSSLGFPASEF